MNLNLVFAMVGGKVKNDAVATFHDVYGVFGLISGHFSNFPTGLKVIDLISSIVISHSSGLTLFLTLSFNSFFFRTSFDGGRPAL